MRLASVARSIAADPCHSPEKPPRCLLQVKNPPRPPRSVQPERSSPRRGEVVAGGASLRSCKLSQPYVDGGDAVPEGDEPEREFTW